MKIKNSIINERFVIWADLETDNHDRLVKLNIKYCDSNGSKTIWCDTEKEAREAYNRLAYIISPDEPIEEIPTPPVSLEEQWKNEPNPFDTQDDNIPF